MLTVLYFLSQLCTYTPGIVFYGCGDILLANRVADHQARITRAQLIPGPNPAWNTSDAGNMDHSASFAVKEENLVVPIFLDETENLSGPLLHENTEDLPGPLLQGKIDNLSAPLLKDNTDNPGPVNNNQTNPMNLTSHVKRNVNYR